MKNKVKVSKGGKINIPPDMWNKTGWGEGDILKFETVDHYDDDAPTGQKVIIVKKEINNKVKP